MADEPAYLKMLRQSSKTRDRKEGPPAKGAPSVAALTVQEKEATKWAREVAGTDLRSVTDLSGARYAVLLKIASVTGTAHHSLQGLASRELLLARLQWGTGMGEEVLGAYEVRGGRPITIGAAEGETTLTLGSPRPGANPLPPEKMIRKAAAEAEKREKTRGTRKEGGRGGR